MEARSKDQLMVILNCCHELARRSLARRCKQRSRHRAALSSQSVAKSVADRRGPPPPTVSAKERDSLSLSLCERAEGILILKPPSVIHVARIDWCEGFHSDETA